jgi:RHS repeat-associated protein
VQSTHLDTDGTTVLSSDSYSYEPGGEVQSHTNSLGGVTTTFYNIMGKPEYQMNPDSSTNGWRYYLDGRTYKEIQGNGAYWLTTYDDVDRITTRVLCSPTGVPEATNSVQLDRRGNKIQVVDAGFNAFNSTYDGLDRIKYTAGPSTTNITETGMSPGDFTYVTNITQHTLAYFYDAAGRFITTSNALAQLAVNQFDAIARPLSTKNYNSTGTLVHEVYTGYSPDNNSVIVTNGSGSGALVKTVWIDTDGHTVLSIAYPSSGSTEFTENEYDLAGNLVLSQHDSSSSGSVTTWTSASSTFDGLNRVTSTTDRDGAVTYFAYDPLNDLTNRTMPGNLIWQASYNNAGQISQEQVIGGGNPTRTTTYIYNTSGPFAGLLYSKTDGRGTVCSYLYDDWLATTNMTCTGSLSEQNTATTWKYDARRNLIGMTEQFANTNTGLSTSIQRAYDSYGELSGESVSDGSFSYSANQSWDVTGRRSMLGFPNNDYSFGYQGDGSMISAGDSTGTGAYTYSTAGILTNRTVGIRNTGITSLDGEGRPLTVGTTIDGESLTETLSYSGDGLLQSDTLNRPDFPDSRIYSYANLSRRLTYEQLNLNDSTTWTNTFAYDNGTTAGPGALTQMGQANGSSGLWDGGVDAFSRINSETNNTFSYPAYGHVNGQSTLSAWLDNNPISISGYGTNAMQWQTTMELSPGSHQLTVAALHPSGRFTAWATNYFTNSLAFEATSDSYDAAGEITNRVWHNPSGTIEKTQTLSWDARGRLHAITQRDANNSGYNWTAVYDPLNRRIATTTVLVTNGVVYPASSQTINSYFDPSADFLELGVSYGIHTEWKLYGPDLSGAYAGMNGIGGLDAVSPALSLFNPLVTDVRGDVLGYYDSSVGNVTWNAARPTGYGAVPGYRPVALASGADLEQSSVWRGLWPDVTGYYNIGQRPYDPVSGCWLTYDSAWNASDPNYYSFCGGDPINGFDSNGKCVQNAPQNLYFGVAPVMDIYLETKTFFTDGTSVSTGLPGEPSSVIYDPNTVGGNEYNWVTMQTGQSAFYVSQTPLPANFGDTISTPITQADLEEQADIQFVKTVAVVGATVATDTEEAAPELLTPETYYRTMSEADYATLGNTGQIPATGETFISPNLQYAQQYNGVTVQFNVQAGTQNALMDIGVRNSAAGLTGTAYEDLPLVSGGWTDTSAFFKFEGQTVEGDPLVNIGLGKGTALDTFNANIINFKPVPKP